MVIRTKEQWLALFQQQKESGLNATTFCKKNNLCPKYFSKRKSDINWEGKIKSLSKQIPKLVKIGKCNFTSCGEHAVMCKT